MFFRHVDHENFLQTIFVEIHKPKKFKDFFAVNANSQVNSKKTVNFYKHFAFKRISALLAYAIKF